MFKTIETLSIRPQTINLWDLLVRFEHTFSAGETLLCLLGKIWEGSNKPLDTEEILFELNSTFSLGSRITPTESSLLTLFESVNESIVDLTTAEGLEEAKARIAVLTWLVSNPGAIPKSLSERPTMVIGVFKDEQYVYDLLFFPAWNGISPGTSGKLHEQKYYNSHPPCYDKWSEVYFLLKGTPTGARV